MEQQSDPNPPNAIPMAYSPSEMPVYSKKPRFWLWLLIGGGGIVALLVVCAGGFTYFLMSRHAAIEPVVDAFQAKVDAGEFSGAYRSIGPEWKAVNSEGLFTSFESSVHDQMGKLLNKSMISVNIQGGSNSGTATIVYNCTYEKGPATVTYTLAKSTGVWLLIGHTVDSLNMKQLATCPQCAAVAKDWSDYCAQCGAKMNR